MSCGWVRFGPSFDLVLAVIAVIVTPVGPMLACRLRTICHVCA